MLKLSAKKLALIGGLLVISTLVMAQSWFNFPLVGGPSFCISTNNNVCVTSAPAGPALTGDETIPAETNVSGRVPTTVRLSQQNLGIGPYQYSAPVNGQVVNVAPQTQHLILQPAGTIAALTVRLQPSTMLVDNQRFSLCTTAIVTAFSMGAGSGTTILGAPTALLVPVTTGGGSCPSWVYRQTNTTWYRTH